jgi:adenylate cyclase
MLTILKSPFSANTKLKWNKLLTITMAWGFVGVVISIYDHFLLGSLVSKGKTASYSLMNDMLFNVGIGIAAALSGGSYIVFVVNEKYRDSPYWKSIALVAGSFIAVSSSLICIVAFIQTIVQSDSAWNWALMKLYLTDQGHLKNVLVWLGVLILTQITIQVNDKFGQRVLLNFILGKYHNPREETRIFMFVDLFSSTSIAEKLGNEKYHLLLRDFFADITNAILNNRGEIYQYVGDEIVISWRIYSNGMDNDCFRCYAEMCRTITEMAQKYVTRYGLVPDFKAGLHYGKVVAGEIGIIKREITFSGDVLNTTSRIQGKCNEYSVKILSSDDLLSILPISNFYQRISLGDIELRGKGDKVAISTLQFASGNENGSLHPDKMLPAL